MKLLAAVFLLLFGTSTAALANPLCVCNAGTARVLNTAQVYGRNTTFTIALPFVPAVGNALVVFVSFDASYGANNLSSLPAPWLDVRAANEGQPTGGNADMAVFTKVSTGAADQSLSFSIGHFGGYIASFFEISSAASIQPATINLFNLQTSPVSPTNFAQTGNLIITGFAANYLTETPQAGWTDFPNYAVLPNAAGAAQIDVQTNVANTVLSPATVTFDQALNGVVAVVQVGSVAPKYAYDTIIMAEPTLLHYYPMEEVSGNVMTDVKGTINGTYSGSYAFLRGLGMDDGSAGVENKGYNGFESVNGAIPASIARNMTIELVSNQQAGFYQQGYSKFFTGFGQSLQNGFAFPVGTNALSNASTFHQENLLGPGIVKAFYKLIAPYNIVQISLSHLYDMVYTTAGIDSYVDGNLVESCRATITVCRTVDDFGGLTTGVWVGGGYAGFNSRYGGSAPTGPGVTNGQIVSTSITEANQADSSSPAVVGRLAIYTGALTATQIRNHALMMRSTVP